MMTSSWRDEVVATRQRAELKRAQKYRTCAVAVHFGDDRAALQAHDISRQHPISSSDLCGCARGIL